ncbi:PLASMODESMATA CALLOSE-BINDING PROTEIN 3-like isoform X2 [Pistacia vera]|uniref:PLASMODESMATA CALLOSE-BINDING PROTEIN 3-like isoform X2 n=1 Tax=Pistacia vera TaxID=55513 RepID=UPI001263A431|nr:PLASMODESMATA CALLOSE-BINDING PROTEIN 3-like isoform X2 [Pistacia vera]
MAAIVYLVLFFAMTGHSSALYCLCKDGVGDSALQKAIDYACGAGADCTPIIQNGVCYNPNTVKDHCNYAVNSYFQKKGQTTGSCDFAGAAATSANPPSNVASTCVYPSTASTGTGNGSTPTTTPSTTPTTTTPTTTTPTTTPTTSTTPSTTTGTPNVFGGTTGSLGPTGSGITDSSAGPRFSTTTHFFFSMAVASSLALLWG